MIPYFNKGEEDERFYDTFLAPRLPKEILDAHSHMNLPEHVANVPQTRIASDWAMQAGFQMTAKEAAFYAKTLFPQQVYRFAAFPFPVKEGDMRANNQYLARCQQEGQIEYALMAVLPDWTLDEIAGELPHFVGLKPYPDFLSSGKGAQVSIFDFLPRAQLALAEHMGKCVVLHLPRMERLADAENIRQLRQIAVEFPQLKLIIAHVGRCFNRVYWDRAIQELGDVLNHFYFDTAAVMNPEVLQQVFQVIKPSRLLFGLDWPIFLWHGRRLWSERGYQNVCREALAWQSADLEARAGYTFFVYEQLRNLLDAMDRAGWNPSQREGFFCGNARTLMESCRSQIVREVGKA